MDFLLTLVKMTQFKLLSANILFPCNDQHWLQTKLKILLFYSFFAAPFSLAGVMRSDLLTIVSISLEWLDTLC